MSGEASINADNYWDVADKLQSDYLKQFRKQMPMRNVKSFLFSVLKRIAVGYIVLPATIAFIVFLGICFTDGFPQTVNALFPVGGRKHLTPAQAENLLVFWHLTALFTFAASWKLVRWRSPSRRKAASLMEAWHTEHEKVLAS